MNLLSLFRQTPPEPVVEVAAPVTELVAGRWYNVPGLGPNENGSGYIKLAKGKAMATALYKGRTRPSNPRLDTDQWETSRGQRLCTARWTDTALANGWITPAAPVVFSHPHLLVEDLSGEFRGRPTYTRVACGERVNAALTTSDPNRVQCEACRTGKPDPECEP